MSSAQQQQLRPQDRPRLANGVRMQTDRATGQPVLLFPEGVVQLNATGVAILTLCDGLRSIDEVVAELSRQFKVEATVLLADVTEYLARLRAGRLIEAAAPADAPKSALTKHTASAPASALSSAPSSAPTSAPSSAPTSATASSPESVPARPSMLGNLAAPVPPEGTS